MTKDKALKLALKALRFARDDGYENEVSQQAITAIKQALEQPVQEPVAWLHPANATCVTTDPTAYARGIPLYTTPPAQPAPKQEQIESAKQIWREDQQRIAELSAEIDRLTAAQRQWVGLTEQEAAECWSTSTVRTWQAIEAKLKEKNT
jgi:hypothetical protein